MDKICYEEIVSVLAMFGRPDLIAEFKEHMKIDDDYKPPNFVKKEYLSDNEGSATSEEQYEVEVDSEGFLSLK